MQSKYIINVKTKKKNRIYKYFTNLQKVLISRKKLFRKKNIYNYSNSEKYLLDARIYYKNQSAT